MNRTKSIYLFLFFLFIPFIGNAFAQEKVDKEPFPAGGINAIVQNVTYPAEAKKAGLEGTVFVKAVISETGDVLSAEVQKSVDKFLDEAAVKAVKITKFEPAEKNGEKVKSEITVPIKFKLDGKKK